MDYLYWIQNDSDCADTILFTNTGRNEEYEAVVQLLEALLEQNLQASRRSQHLQAGGQTELPALYELYHDLSVFALAVSR